MSYEAMSTDQICAEYGGTPAGLVQAMGETYGIQVCGDDGLNTLLQEPSEQILVFDPIWELAGKLFSGSGGEPNRVVNDLRALILRCETDLSHPFPHADLCSLQLGIEGMIQAELRDMFKTDLQAPDSRTYLLAALVRGGDMAQQVVRGGYPVLSRSIGYIQQIAIPFLCLDQYIRALVLAQSCAKQVDVQLLNTNFGFTSQTNVLLIPPDVQIGVLSSFFSGVERTPIFGGESTRFVYANGGISRENAKQHQVKYRKVCEKAPIGCLVVSPQTRQTWLCTETGSYAGSLYSLRRE